MEKAVVYIRVSTEEQAVDGVSLHAQRERLEAYCASKGLQVKEVVADEGVSATKPLGTRPGGKRVLEALKSKDTRHVVSLKLDRLFRNAEDALRNTTEWERRGVALHLVDLGGQSIDSGSAVGRMMLGMLASFAQFERDLVSERTAAALAYKRKHSEAYNHEPFGFDRSGDTFIPNPTETAVIDEIRGWRERGDTFRVIADRLNLGQVPSKRGGTWHPATVQKVLRLHAATPRRLAS